MQVPRRLGAKNLHRCRWPWSPATSWGLSAGSLREPPRRISFAGRCTAHAKRRPQGELQSQGTIREMRRGAGAGAPARSAPFHRPQRRPHGFRCAPRTFTRGAAWVPAADCHPVAVEEEAEARSCGRLSAESPAPEQNGGGCAAGGPPGIGAAGFGKARGLQQELLEGVKSPAIS
jgi:hypothetical protein